MSLPGGSRTVLAENLIATLLDLEVASGNDALSSHSDIRKSAKLMAQFLPGTDFICSGYSSIPKEDNLFGGGNFDAEDLDDYLVLQRDFLVDGGIRPVQEDEVISVRRTAGKAMQAIFKEMRFPEITEEEIEAASCAHSSQDMPKRNRVADIKASERILAENITGIDLVRALYNHGFTAKAKNIFEIEKQRISGDYLQTSAILDRNFNVISAINDPNDYAGPPLSGSGVAIGIQSKGTAVIHQKDLMPLNNLELLSQASNLTLPAYREAGRNAARYAKGERPTPIHVPIDNTARLRYIVKATLMHMEETRHVNSKRRAIDVQVQFLD